MLDVAEGTGQTGQTTHLTTETYCERTNKTCDNYENSHKKLT